MTTTERRLPNVDPALLIAYDLQPDDMTLVGAIADAAREAGDDLLAEFLDFVRKWRLVPADERAGYLPTGTFWDVTTSMPSDLWLNRNSDRRERERPSETLWRLWVGWQRSSPEQRAEYKQWKPPE